MKDPAGLDPARLEENACRSRPLGSLELCAPAVRVGVVAPMVAAWCRNFDVHDFAKRVQSLELKMNVLNVARLELVAGANVIMGILPDPAP